MSFNSLITLVIYPKEMFRDTLRAFYNKDVNPNSVYRIWKQQTCQTMVFGIKKCKFQKKKVKQWNNTLKFWYIHAMGYSAV